MARIIVAPDKRAAGYGEHLCRALLRLARQKGCREISLNVYRRLARQKGCREISLNVYRENTSAHRLYTSAGFREVIERSRPVTLKTFYDSLVK
ncbi:MAG: GNAT family N-acetyltransferase [Deltaproteobacteria bacterium]|nr:GNAT family N-acetyltransferase [Deltaproteobacteria bacterium]